MALSVTGATVWCVLTVLISLSVLKRQLMCVLTGLTALSVAGATGWCVLTASLHCLWLERQLLAVC